MRSTRFDARPSTTAGTSTTIPASPRGPTITGGSTTPTPSCGRARGDIDREEDNGAILGLRGRAAGHIEGAIMFTENAIRAVAPGATRGSADREPGIRAAAGFDGSRAPARADGAGPGLEHGHGQWRGLGHHHPQHGDSAGRSFQGRGRQWRWSPLHRPRLVSGQRRGGEIQSAFRQSLHLLWRAGDSNRRQPGGHLRGLRLLGIQPRRESPRQRHHRRQRSRRQSPAHHPRQMAGQRDLRKVFHEISQRLYPLCREGRYRSPRISPSWYPTTCRIPADAQRAAREWGRSSRARATRPLAEDRPTSSSKTRILRRCSSMSDTCRLCCRHKWRYYL